jgi:hypothetical protein
LLVSTKDRKLRLAVSCIAILLLVASHATAEDGEDIALRKYHPWGRFHAGSWNRVRIITETIDNSGRVTATSVTDTKSTLAERGLESYSLRLETSVDLAGKRIPSQPQTIRLGYAGENLGEQLSYYNLDDDNLLIDGRKIPCAVQEVEIVGAGQKQITQVHYSHEVSPFVLHRKTTQTDLARPSQGHEAEFFVLALDMPFKVNGQLQTTAHTKQVQKGPKGTTVSLSVVSPKVPGELISQHTKKTDEQGKITHRSSLELIGYFVAPEPAPVADESAEFRTPRRYHKRNRHERR